MVHYRIVLLILNLLGETVLQLGCVFYISEHFVFCCRWHFVLFLVVLIFPGQRQQLTQWGKLLADMLYLRNHYLSQTVSCLISGNLLSLKLKRRVCVKKKNNTKNLG